MEDKLDKKSNEATVDEIIEKNFGKPDNEDNDNADDGSEIDPTTRNTAEQSSDTEEDEQEEELDYDNQSQMLSELRDKVNALKEEGNCMFRNGDFDEAIRTYSKGIRMCRAEKLYPEKAILYSNRAVSELKLNGSKQAIHSASRAIKYNPEYSKGYLRRAKAHELDDKLDESLADYKKLLELDPKSKEAFEAIPDLERRINERNEKMKAEMMDKLKDLGNLVLRPFGLSTNNFQMAQDPKTGGYSINFKQN